MPPAAGENPSDVQIIDAFRPPDLDAVRQLFLEYAASLGFDLCF